MGRIIVTVVVVVLVISTTILLSLLLLHFFAYKLGIFFYFFSFVAKRHFHFAAKNDERFFKVIEPDTVCCSDRATYFEVLKFIKIKISVQRMVFNLKIALINRKI